MFQHVMLCCAVQALHGQIVLCDYVAVSLCALMVSCSLCTCGGEVAPRVCLLLLLSAKLALLMLWHAISAHWCSIQTLTGHLHGMALVVL